jgi:hypothetical protein
MSLSESGKEFFMSDEMEWHKPPEPEVEAHWHKPPEPAEEAEATSDEEETPDVEAHWHKPPAPSEWHKPV